MTTSADDNENESTGPAAAFVTPQGVFTDPDDLPPLLRQILVATLSAPDMDPEVHAAMARALGVENRNPAAARTETSVDTDHRAVVWDLLDATFPNDPHLWRAGEAMLSASTAGPNAPDADARREAIDTAIAHLERHRSLNEPPLSPLDAIVAKFRAQMGGL